MGRRPSEIQRPKRVEVELSLDEAAMLELLRSKGETRADVVRWMIVATAEQSGISARRIAKERARQANTVNVRESRKPLDGETVRRRAAQRHARALGRMFAKSGAGQPSSSDQSPTADDSSDPTGKRTPN